jgi:hypothetical protein
MEMGHIVEELRALRADIQDIREDLRQSRGFIGGVVWVIGALAAVLGFAGSYLKGEWL